MSWVWTWIFKQLLSVFAIWKILTAWNWKFEHFYKKKAGKLYPFWFQTRISRTIIHSFWMILETFSNDIMTIFIFKCNFMLENASLFFPTRFFSFLLMRHDTQSRVISKDTQKITRWRFNLAIESRLKWRCILKCKTICYQKDHIKT